jgi:hypothetical protein
MMRNIIGQTKSAFDLRQIMDNKKILLVNLSKGRTGELNSKLLGMVFVMKFQAAAMSRSDIPEEQRQDFALYVDEFQNFSTDSFATIMSEARKYHLNLIVANQFTTQLTEEIRDAVFGNIGTIVSFRIGQNDVDSLSRYFQPTFDGEDLLRVPNANTIVRTLVNGVPTQPFSMATLPPLGNPNPGLAGALKQLSAAKYGKPRAAVEKAIFERLQTRTPAAKPFQSPFGQPGGAPAQPNYTAGVPTQPAAQVPATPAKPSGGSFLDEWMAKQRAAIPAPAISTARTSLPPSAPTAQPAVPPQATAQQVASAPNLPPIQPVLTHQAPAQPADELVDDGNVSSAQLDQQEINDIATELKKGLKPAASGPAPEPEPVAPKQEATAGGVAKAPTPEPAKEGEVSLKAMVPTPVAQNDDTIFIDTEGKFQLRETPPESDKPPDQAATE